MELPAAQEAAAPLLGFGQSALSQYFKGKIDGPALATSEMDVRELAPALLAIGDLLTASTNLLCGERPVWAPANYQVIAWKMAFSIVSLAFKEDNKWRLHDGNFHYKCIDC